MSAFTYYLPGQAHDKVTPDLVRGVGLGERLGDCLGRVWHKDLARIPITNKGPDGGAGAMLVPRRVDEVDTPLWNPNEWDATESHDGKFWLCWRKGELPGPEELRRRTIVKGKLLELADGRVWECPVIRSQFFTPEVPSICYRRGDYFFRKPKPEYVELAGRSVEWATWYLMRQLENIKAIPPSILLEIATSSLGLNYRIGHEEAEALGMFDDANLESVFHITIDGEWFDANHPDNPQKKTDLRQLAADIISLGSGGSVPITGPQPPS